jgi:type II secretory pathway component GspD/PulD (secretin)
MKRHKIFIPFVCCFLSLCLNQTSVLLGNSSRRETLPKDGNTPAQVRAEKTAEPNEELVDVNLKDAGIRTIFEILTKLMTKPIIPGNVPELKISVDAVRVPKSKAIRLILDAIKQAGFRVEETETAIIIALQPLPENRWITDVTNATELREIKEKNQIARLIIKLEYLSSTQVAQIVQPFLSKSSYMYFDSDSGYLFLIETVNNLIDIERIIRMFDLPSADKYIRQIFKLQYIDPNKAAEIINIILHSNQKKTSIILDFPARKWLVVQAPVEIVGHIGQWLQKLDVEDADKRDYELITIKYVDVTELAENIKSYLTQMWSFPGEPYIFIQPLPLSKQILIYDRPESLALIKKLIAQIDYPIRNEKIRIETTILTTDDELLKEVGKKLNPTLDSNTPLNDRQVEALLKAVRALKDSKIIVEPNILASDCRSASLFKGKIEPFITGYTEPNSQSQEAKPVYEQRQVGIFCEITPIIKENETIQLSVRYIISQITGSQERTFNGKYKVEVPTISEVIGVSIKIIPYGKTFLVDCGTVTLYDNNLTDSAGRKKVILLVKPTVLSP